MRVWQYSGREMYATVPNPVRLHRRASNLRSRDEGVVSPPVAKSEVRRSPLAQAFAFGRFCATTLAFPSCRAVPKGRSLRLITTVVQGPAERNVVMALFCRIPANARRRRKAGPTRAD
jgi:hypothetical protein